MSLRGELKAAAEERKDKYCMVLWDGEDTVSIVHVEQVLSSKTNVGEQCSVKAGRHTYKGKILAVGKKEEMKNAEDEYVVSQLNNIEEPEIQEERGKENQLNNIEEPEIQEERGKENQPAIANEEQVAKTAIRRKRRLVNDKGAKKPSKEKFDYDVDKSDEITRKQGKRKKGGEEGKKTIKKGKDKEAGKILIIGKGNTNNGPSKETTININSESHSDEDTTDTNNKSDEVVIVTNKAHGNVDAFSVSNSEQSMIHTSTPKKRCLVNVTFSSIEDENEVVEDGSSLNISESGSLYTHITIDDINNRLKQVETTQSNVLEQLQHVQQFLIHANPSLMPYFTNSSLPFTNSLAPLARNYLPFSSSSLPFSSSSLPFSNGHFSSMTIPPFANSQPAGDKSQLLDASNQIPSGSSTYQNMTQMSNEVSVSVSEEPLPLTNVSLNSCLSSDEIEKQKLIPVKDVIRKYPKLITESKIGALSCKIAKEALFGTYVMERCTPIGTRHLPGLPYKELTELKKILFQQFPKYARSPVEFESTWKKCLEAVQQACKRLRNGKD